MARVLLLGGKLDLQRRSESTKYDLEVITRKVEDTQGDNTDMVTGLHQDTVGLYAFIRHGVDEVLVKVSGRLKKAFDVEARNLR